MSFDWAKWRLFITRIDLCEPVLNAMRLSATWQTFAIIAGKCFKTSRPPHLPSGADRLPLPQRRARKQASVRLAAFRTSLGKCFARTAGCNLRRWRAPRRPRPAQSQAIRRLSRHQLHLQRQAEFARNAASLPRRRTFFARIAVSNLAGQPRYRRIAPP